MQKPAKLPDYLFGELRSYLLHTHVSQGQASRPTSNVTRSKNGNADVPRQLFPVPHEKVLPSLDVTCRPVGDVTAGQAVLRHGLDVLLVSVARRLDVQHPITRIPAIHRVPVMTYCKLDGAISEHHLLTTKLNYKYNCII